MAAIDYNRDGRGDRDEDCEVLIAGAGPVGLSLALALQRYGVDFRIVDEAAGFSGASKAITVQPRILEALELLDAAAPLVSAGVRTGVMHMHVGTKRMTTLRYDRLPSPFPFYLHLHQGESERLLAGLLAERGVEVERGLGLRDFSTPAQSQGQGVEVELETREGEPRTIRARYLVGCDGGHSRVRERLGVEFCGERHGDNWIMADVRIANFDLARDQRHGFMLENFPFVVLPMTDGYFRVIAARRPGSPRTGQDPTLAEFEAIARSLGFGAWRFEAPLWLTNYNPSQFIVSQFRRGPVFLAGDAAHVNTPIGAQGLNTGVMDALNLGWKLAWTLRHGASEALLDSYHDERHPVVLGMFRDNDRLTRMVFGRNPLTRKLARRQLRLLEIPTLNLRNTSNSAQLSVAYPDSPVIPAQREPGLAPELRQRLGQLVDGIVDGVGSAVPGERAPCPPLSGPRPGAEHLYDLLDGARHTLLVFDDGRGAAGAWAEAVAGAESSWLGVSRCVRGERDHDPGARRWADPQGELAAAFGFAAGGAVLVRPDAIVAARLELGQTGALARYARLLGRSQRASGPESPTRRARPSHRLAE